MGGHTTGGHTTGGHVAWFVTCWSCDIRTEAIAVTVFAIIRA